MNMYLLYSPSSSSFLLVRLHFLSVKTWSFALFFCCRFRFFSFLFSLFWSFCSWKFRWRKKFQTLQFFYLGLTRIEGFCSTFMVSVLVLVFWGPPPLVASWWYEVIFILSVFLFNIFLSCELNTCCREDWAKHLVVLRRHTVSAGSTCFCAEWTCFIDVLQAVIYCTIIYWLDRQTPHWLTNETVWGVCFICNLSLHEKCGGGNGSSGKDYRKPCSSAPTFELKQKNSPDCNRKCL